MTETASFAPSLVLILAGLAIGAASDQLRRALLLVAPALALAALWIAWAQATCPDAAACAVTSRADYLGFELQPIRIDRLALLYGTVFCLATFAGGLYALDHEDRRELAAAYVYAGSALGAVLAGDLLTLFVYWELMAISSTVVVWAGGEGARAAGLRYAAIHFLAGVLLMAGAAGHIVETGSVVFTGMELGSVATWLILASFLINAGGPPLGAWVADAYPRASLTGMVFLSAFTTKTAVYTMIRGFPGEEALVWIGLFMIAYGLVYALTERDMRRLLAYAIVNQVGIMVAAIGIGTPLALDGAATQSFVHILYKALLIMTAGAVIHATGRRGLDELGGLARAMPVTTLCAVVGAATALALPLTAGFASKSLISAGIGYSGELLVWLAITGASAATVLNAGLRYQWFAFFRQPDGPVPAAADPPGPMRAAMVLLAALCLAFGPLYGLLYGLAPGGADYAPYTAGHVVSQLALVLGAALAFVLLRGMLAPRPGRLVDVDWFWRRGGRAMVRALGGAWLDAYGRAASRAVAAVERFVDRLYRTHGPESGLARTRPSGYMALWMTMLLGVIMLFAFV